MRKIAALFLVLAIVVAFAACGRKDKEETTAPIITGSTMPTASTPVAPSSSEPTSQLNANPTYILTTSPDKTVPWGDTTKFTTMPSTTVPSSIIINIPTDENSQPVAPSYSVAPTQSTTPLQPGSSSPNGSSVNTTKPTTTKPIEKKPVSVEVGAKAFNGEDVLIVDIDGSKWSSVFVANTQYLPVSIDGNPTGKNVKCALSGTPDAAGNYTISIDVSSLSLAPNAVVSVGFPEGYIQTKAGTQYSNSFEVFATF